jgi:hypothetical protein
MMASGRRGALAGIAVVLVMGLMTSTAQAQIEPDLPGEEQESTQLESLAQVSSINFVAGISPEHFKVVIHSEAERQFATFWVRNGRTLVTDIRDTYTPFRGRAVGEMQIPSVAEVRASQFLEKDAPIARIELDLTRDYAATAVWIGTDLEISFQPGTPGFVGTGSTREPSGRPAGEPGVEAGPPGTVPPGAQVGVLPGGRTNPFDPLLKAPENVDLTNVLARDLPDVETMTLTGTVIRTDDPAASIALLRDANGLTYRLKKGDRVKYGFVSEIRQNEIVFQLDRFGRVYEFKLTLDGPS